MENNPLKEILPNDRPDLQPSNLLLTLSSRRRNNAKNQLRSVLLEMYELFGSDFVSEVSSECHQIYLEYCKLTKPSKRTKSSSK